MIFWYYFPGMNNLFEAVLIKGKLVPQRLLGRVFG